MALIQIDLPKRISQEVEIEAAKMGVKKSKAIVNILSKYFVSKENEKMSKKHQGVKKNVRKRT